MEGFRLCNSDYRFMTIVWDHAPVGSGELVRLCQTELGWKKSTTYTEIRRLCEKGFLKNEKAVVEPLVKGRGAGAGIRCFCGADLWRIAAGISDSLSGGQETVGKGGGGTEAADRYLSGECMRQQNGRKRHSGI